MINHRFFKPARGTMTAALACLSAATIAISALSQPASAATSVSQFGFTWTFSQDKTVGQYANGDWWVIGPVTITRISPACVTDSTGWTRNGTMVNPLPGTISPAQGFDSSVSKYAWYDGSLNVSPGYTGSPLTVAAGSTVVSANSVDAPNTSTSYAQLADAAVLTVISSAPAAGSFRPPVVGTDKVSHWNKSSLNYGILQKLAPVASTPDLATVAGFFERPWLALKEAASVQSMSPVNNMPNYGRDQAQRLSLGLLSLHLNYTDAQKETLYIRLVQYGIDIYGSVNAGMIFTDNGGTNCGRKAPLVLAGLALNDPNMLEWADASKHFVFQEDRQTWYVTQADVGRVMNTADGRPRETYTQSMVGLPEWGIEHASYPQYDASNWSSAFYRWAGGSWQGNVLAIILIPGGQAAWNHPVTFAYADRYWSLEGPNGQANQSWSGVNSISPFVWDMWTYYRSGSVITPPPPPPVVTFAIGNRIQLTTIANVRASASLTATLAGTQPVGALGTLVGGPVVADSLTWWQVDYDNGVDGWSGVDNFILSNTSPPPAPTFAIGDRIATTNNTNVRATGTLAGTLLGVQAGGATGTIVAGPIQMDSITWWQVNFDSGADGWSGGDNFTKSTNPLPTVPSAPQGLKVVP